MSAEELLPCPFCGGEARLTAAMGETWMRCIDCNAGSEMSGSRALAIAAWNRRTPPAMSADHIGEASNMVAPVAALSSKPVDDTGEANSSVKFHVEAVAWRFWHEGGWNFSLADPSPHLADCVERDALYTHPAPIKPSGDTGELRERVARLIVEKGRLDLTAGFPPFGFIDNPRELADEILDLIQSERAG